MESYSLAWRFLLDHPATPYFVPIPWHLLTVLFLLGLLAAGGLHHLLGHTLNFYKVPSGVAGWLALPSFAVILLSTQLLLGIYLLTALAPDMVRFALGTPDAQNSAVSIGNLLLSPAFGENSTDDPKQNALNRAGLNRALHAYSPKELQDGFRRQLAEALAQPAAEQNAAGGGGDASPELLLMALHWAAEAHEDWPPRMAEKAALAGEFGGAPGEAKAAAQPALSRYILSLVEEIGWESDMARRDWAHVAGNRFMQRVLGPLMVWQVRWLAMMTLLLLLAADLTALFLLSQLKRLVHPQPRPEQGLMAP